MDTILRSGEMAEITFLPIRHHSPACAWHVRDVIGRLRPDSILVEGPENANELIPVMVHEDTRAPFAVYYSYRDRAGRISQEKQDYKCYYPFLDYSPELTALREGERLGIPTSFIDLPYDEILAASEVGRGLLREGEKTNYNDDYLLSGNRLVERLCEKTGLRSFEEFWEKYFELDGIRQTSEELFSHLGAYCNLARLNTPIEVIRGEGSLAREAHMAARIIREAKALREAGNDAPDKDRARILVVTGGFHTPGLMERLNCDDAWEAAGEDGGKAEKKENPDQSVYLMPYSMEAADALNGYASGMPFPGFYQKGWDKIQEGNSRKAGDASASDSDNDLLQGPYGRAVFEILVAAGKETRKKEGYLSTYDEICACMMADGLAKLREKAEPGAYELLDAVLSSYIKGEHNLSTNTPMQILRGAMTGSRIGRLCDGASVPPIVTDFETNAKLFGISYRSTVEREVTLSIFSSEKHRRMSMFFHRVGYLTAAFARKIKGPDLQSRRDKNLMREVWKYKWSTQVMAALIDVSVYGATVEEACVTLSGQALIKELGAKEAVILLTRVFEMGLGGQLRPVYDRMYDLVSKDTDFYSIAEALSYLLMLEDLEQLYHSGLVLGPLLSMCGRKLIALLPSMVSIKDENLADCMKACKILYQLTGRSGCEEERKLYTDCLETMAGLDLIHPGLHGCVCGILYGGGNMTAADTERACRGYLTGTKDQQRKTAVFFRGLFYTARDLVFIGNQFLVMLDTFLAAVEDEDFLELLPELKLAFGYFTPREIDRIAGEAAKLHGISRQELRERHRVEPGWRAYGMELDAFVKLSMEGDHDGG